MYNTARVSPYCLITTALLIVCLVTVIEYQPYLPVAFQSLSLIPRIEGLIAVGNKNWTSKGIDEEGEFVTVSHSVT